MKPPFFSIVIPLYNKEKDIRDTILSVLNQNFLNFEVVIVNDGSSDNSKKIVETIKDPRIKLVNQDNVGVSAARNRGIQESSADYVVFLDADDLWLPHLLDTIYNLVNDFPDAGLYATAYKKQKANGKIDHIDIRALPSKDYRGLIPNYFESIVKGDFLIWTSAVCVPKKIFVDSNIWFPEGEKYGEDQYVWARIAMIYDIAYDTIISSIYKVETDNNSRDAGDKEKDPLTSVLKLKDFREHIRENKKLFYFDRYIEKEYLKTIKRNVINGKNLYALHIFWQSTLSLKNQVKAIMFILMPYKLYRILRKKGNK